MMDRYATREDLDGRVAVALTIAGSDSGGGAGIQADLKTFQRFGVFGTSALTLVTSQNTVGVGAVHMLPVPLVQQQLGAVVRDLGPLAAKTGALGSPAMIAAVAEAVTLYEIDALVVDPVMISKHGVPLLADEAVAPLRDRLLPHARLVTPNLREAEALVGRANGTIRDEAAMLEVAEAILAFGPEAVLMKGGHLERASAVDLLVWRDRGGGALQTRRFDAERVDTKHTHGTGCTYSAAITALLARGEALQDAVATAKAFMSRAIATAPGLGQGFGPVNHLA